MTPERPLVKAPGFHEIAAAARVLCNHECAAAPCSPCKPGSMTWDLTIDILCAAGVLDEPTTDSIHNEKCNCGHPENHETCDRWDCPALTKDLP